MEPVAEVSVQETKVDPLDTIFFQIFKGESIYRIPPVPAHGGGKTQKSVTFFEKNKKAQKLFLEGLKWFLTTRDMFLDQQKLFRNFGRNP